MKKWFIGLGILLSALLLLILLRNPILRGIGNYLIYEQPLEKSDAILMLGGNSIGRGREAAKIYHEGFAPKIITTSENIPGMLALVGIQWSESCLAKMVMEEAGVPPEQILAFEVATSTKEEGDFLLKYCTEHQLKKVILISDKFHLRRVKWVFEKQFADAGITIIFHGAADKELDTQQWWKSEDGLIFVNNEYMKLLYYFLKY